MGAPNVKGAVQLSLDLAKLGGLKDIVPTEDVYLDPVQAGADQTLRRADGRLSPSSLARFAIVVAIFALWELLSRTGLVNPRLLPSASDTLATLGELLQRASVRNDLAVTASEVAGRLRPRRAVRRLIGYLIAENRYFAEVVKPLLFFAF